MTHRYTVVIEHADGSLEEEVMTGEHARHVATEAILDNIMCRRVTVHTMDGAQVWEEEPGVWR